MVWHNYEFMKQKDSAFAIAEQGTEEQLGGTFVAEEGFALRRHRRDEEYAFRKVHGTAAESTYACHFSPGLKPGASTVLHASFSFRLGQWKCDIHHKPGD